MLHPTESKKIRKALSIKQHELASFLGISTSNMEMVELGKRQLANTPRLHFLLSVDLSAIPPEPEAGLYGLSETERSDLAIRRMLVDARLKTTHHLLNKMKREVNEAIASKYRIESMIIPDLGKVKKSLELWQAHQLVVKDTLLYKYRKSEMLTVEIKIKTLAAELVCLDEVLGSES